jgi:hypothetical protein
VARTKIVVYFDLQPRVTLSWRVARDAELRAHDARIWLTRHGDLNDYWLEAGEIARLVRGERVWISSEMARPVALSITSYRTSPTSRLQRVCARVLGRWLPRASPGVGVF